jgi:NADH dehydrogenase (ubiquinone) 1 beta subcomplex subunit 9
MFEDGTKWERNLPPPMFTEAEKKAALDAQHH